MERLGELEIDGVLGEGGSAIVYAARRGGEELALKVLRPELLLSEREVTAFLAEAHRAQRVAHPSLVEIRDAGLLPDGRPYLAMPRLRGECLADRLARGPLSIEAALHLFRGLADAVSALHAAGLVHRDIKPENMFVVGEEEHLVLLDLGIARDIDAPSSTTTQAGLVRGTPAYMAPERFFGTRASTVTDTYEAAVTLYVMLTGRLPWEHPQEARGRMSPRDPRSFAPLPDAVAQALLRALSVDETARFPDVRALHDAVEGAALPTADTTRVAVLDGDSTRASTPLSSAVRAVSIRPPEGASPASDEGMRARSAASPAGDLATQDTVAIRATPPRVAGPRWAPYALAVGGMAVAAAISATLARPTGPDGSAAPSAPSPVSAAPATSAPEVVPTAANVAATAAPDESGAPSAAEGKPRSSDTGKPVAPSGASTATTRGQAAGAAFPACAAWLGVACGLDFQAIDHGAQCRQVQATLQSAQGRPAAEWPAINAECKGAWMNALTTLSRSRQTQAR